MFRVIALAVAMMIGCVTSIDAAKSRNSRRSSSNKTTTTINVDMTTAGKAAEAGAKADAISTISQELKKADSKEVGTAANTALLVTISGELAERSDSIVLFSQQSKSLKDYLDTFRRAREDTTVKAVLVRITSSQIGFAQAQELRAAIAELRSRGKKTYGILEDDSQPSYLVAAACDEVVLPPSGELMIYGIKADSYFIRGLLDKVGVKAHVVHVGQYKSFGEMFTNDEFTTPARENMTEIVNDAYDLLVNTIAESRKLPRDVVDAAVNRGPASPQEALAAKLIDRISYTDDLLAELEKKKFNVVDTSDYAKDSTEKSEDMNLFSLFSMMGKGTTAAKASKYPEVAVVYAVGSIQLGSKEGVMFGGEEGIYSDDFIEMLQEIQDDSKVKAVILRVNSPGGSAFASDLIWKKIEELKKHKPVVASMGDVAASGGYYIAMGASKIIAQEGTMTGSIGVVGGKIDLAEIYDKVGINKSTISRGQYATLFSETNGFSQEERALIEKMMSRTYDDFVSKAARSRHVTKEKLNELAQGKVWMGSRAKSVGLVDENGGISRAILETKTLMGLTKDDKVSLIAYPKEVGFVEMLQKALSGNVTAQVSPISVMSEALPTEAKVVVKFANTLKNLFAREKVLAISPFITRLN